jgi:hypothetical protein
MATNKMSCDFYTVQYLTSKARLRGEYDIMTELQCSSDGPSPLSIYLTPDFGQGVAYARLLVSA